MQEISFLILQLDALALRLSDRPGIRVTICQGCGDEMVLNQGFWILVSRIRLAGDCSHVINSGPKARTLDWGSVENFTEQFFQGQGIPTHFSTEQLC
jgi:hypothetical protein